MIVRPGRGRVKQASSQTATAGCACPRCLSFAVRDERALVRASKGLAAAAADAAVPAACAPAIAVRAAAADHPAIGRAVIWAGVEARADINAQTRTPAEAAIAAHVRAIEPPPHARAPACPSAFHLDHSALLDARRRLRAGHRRNGAGLRRWRCPERGQGQHDGGEPSQSEGTHSHSPVDRPAAGPRRACCRSVCLGLVGAVTNLRLQSRRDGLCNVTRRSCFSDRPGPRHIATPYELQ